MYVLVCVLVAGKSLEINHMTLHLQNHKSGLSIKSNRRLIISVSPIRFDNWQNKLHVFEVVLK